MKSVLPNLALMVLAGVVFYFAKQHYDLSSVSDFLPVLAFLVVLWAYFLRTGEVKKLKREIEALKKRRRLS